MFSLWFPSLNCLKLAWSSPDPDSFNSQPLYSSRVFHTVSFTELFKSWPASLQVLNSLIHTPSRTFVFSLWFPLQSCPKLAWSPADPDSTKSHPLQNYHVFLHRIVRSWPAGGPNSTNSQPLQNSRVFLVVPFTDLSKLAWSPGGPDPINYTPYRTFPYRFLHRIVQRWPAGLQVQIH